MTVSTEDLTLAALRSAYVRIQAAQNDLTLIAEGMSCGAISPQQAIDTVIQAGWDCFLPLNLVAVIRARSPESRAPTVKEPAA